MVKSQKPKKYLLFSGLFLILLAAAVGVLIYSLRYDELWHWYAVYNQKLEQLQVYIASLDKHWQFIGMILLLFVIKSVFPIYPTSTVCFLTGVILPMYLSVPVNILGISVLFTIRYFWGKRFGAGQAWKFLSKTEPLQRLLQKEGISNPILLVMLRLIPVMPLNSISGVYGSFDFGFWRYLLYSVLGFLPKLLSFTFVGRNVYDPLSPSFLVPIMIIAFLTGISVLSVNGIWITVENIVTHSKAKKQKKKGSSQK